MYGEDGWGKLAYSSIDMLGHPDAIPFLIELGIHRLGGMTNQM